MNGAEYIIQKLQDEGIDTLFGYPGGCIMPVYDALLGSGIRHILCRHEQGAAFAANGFARSSGKLGVCLATSGPGATNLITAIADAYMDSVPLIAITGQVPSALIGTDAFQEIDVLGLSLPITKHSFLVESSADLPAILDAAFHLAREGRPGPVLIDIPKDIQLAEMNLETIHTQPLHEETAPCPKLPSQESIEQALALIGESHRPIIYAGGGVILADAIEPFRDFVEHTGIPTVLTLKGLGNLPADHPLNMGMLGMHGSVAANNIVQQCDLLIAVGARFDDRVTGRLAQFAPHARVIHLDIDQAETGKLRAVTCPVTGDIRTSLQALAIETDCQQWAALCVEQRITNGFGTGAQPCTQATSAATFLRTLATIASSKAIISCDVGQHQMWVAQHYPISHPRHHLSSGGLGAMGFGLPAAIGAQLAHPDTEVINIAGDGSFMMNVQELATVSRYRLPVKMIVLDNQVLGMVRQQQEICYDKRYSEIDLSDNPEFSAVAQAFGIPAMRLDPERDLAQTLADFMAQPGPALLHVPITPEENVWPMVKPGDANDQMIKGAAA
jgi:acetolactate synthase-1/2/3 large subunit